MDNKYQWPLKPMLNFRVIKIETLNLQSMIRNLTYISKGGLIFCTEWQTSWASAKILSLLVTTPIQMTWLLLPRLFSGIPDNARVIKLNYYQFYIAVCTPIKQPPQGNGRWPLNSLPSKFFTIWLISNWTWSHFKRITKNPCLNVFITSHLFWIPFLKQSI